MITYVYIDGESHFMRSEAAIKTKLGRSVQLCAHIKPRPGERLIVVQAGRVFWSSQFWPGAERYYYFTSMVGDPNLVDGLRLKLRDHNLEPLVFPERKTLRDRRNNTLQSQVLIEKAKQVDTELVVRLILDAPISFSMNATFSVAILICSQRSKRFARWGNVFMCMALKKG